MQILPAPTNAMVRFNPGYGFGGRGGGVRTRSVAHGGGAANPSHTYFGAETSVLRNPTYMDVPVDRVEDESSLSSSGSSSESESIYAVMPAGGGGGGGGAGGYGSGHLRGPPTINVQDEVVYDLADGSLRGRGHSIRRQYQVMECDLDTADTDGMAALSMVSSEEIEL